MHRILITLTRAWSGSCARSVGWLPLLIVQDEGKGSDHGWHVAVGFRGRGAAGDMDGSEAGVVGACYVVDRVLPVVGIDRDPRTEARLKGSEDLGPRREAVVVMGNQPVDRDRSETGAPTHQRAQARNAPSRSIRV